MVVPPSDEERPNVGKATGTRGQIVGRKAGGRTKGSIAGEAKVVPPAKDAPSRKELGLGKRQATRAEKLLDRPAPQAACCWVILVAASALALEMASGLGQRNCRAQVCAGPVNRLTVSSGPAGIPARRGGDWSPPVSRSAKTGRAPDHENPGRKVKKFPIPSGLSRVGGTRRRVPLGEGPEVLSIRPTPIKQTSNKPARAFTLHACTLVGKLC